MVTVVATAMVGCEFQRSTFASHPLIYSVFNRGMGMPIMAGAGAGLLMGSMMGGEWTEDCKVLKAADMDSRINRRFLILLYLLI
jgi:hypothetical protein